MNDDLELLVHRPRLKWSIGHMSGVGSICRGRTKVLPPHRGDVINPANIVLGVRHDHGGPVGQGWLDGLSTVTSWSRPLPHREQAWMSRPVSRFINVSMVGLVRDSGSG